MWIFILFVSFLFMCRGHGVEWFNVWTSKCTDRLSFSFWFGHFLTYVTLKKLPDLCCFQFLICKMGTLIESILQTFVKSRRDIVYKSSQRSICHATNFI